MASSALCAAGFSVLRFDWRAFTAQGAPGVSGDREPEDLEDAIAFAKETSGQERIFLGGKSMGARIAIQRANLRDGDLKGLGLLTLPLHEPGRTGLPRIDGMDLLKLKKPLFFASGDQDRLASQTAFKALMSALPNEPTWMLTGGDHRFENHKNQPSGAAENIEPVVQALVAWSQRLAGA